jgi:PKD repeat protein
LITSNNIHNNGINGGEAGVRVQDAGSLNNFISLNSITQNGGLGIELFNGGNASQPAPTISGGSCTATITGTACPGCIVEIFSDSADEGRIFEGSVDADASSGAFSWDGNPAGPNLTATAANAFLGSTSQFSAPFNIGVCNNPPTAAFTYTPKNVYTCKQVSFDASSSSDAEDPLSALQVRWDWENDGTFDTNFSSQKTAQYRFSSPGVYTTRMEVQDTGGLVDATSHQITVGACLSTFLPLVVR